MLVQHQPAHPIYRRGFQPNLIARKIGPRSHGNLFRLILFLSPKGNHVGTTAMPASAVPSPGVASTILMPGARPANTKFPFASAASILPSSSTTAPAAGLPSGSRTCPRTVAKGVSSIRSLTGSRDAPTCAIVAPGIPKPVTLSTTDPSSVPVFWAKQSGPDNRAASRKKVP